MKQKQRLMTKIFMRSSMLLSSKVRKKNWLLRIGLFSLILMLGTVAVLAVRETTGLALADLSNMSVETMTETTYDDELYAVLSGDMTGIYRSDDTGRSWQKVSAGPKAIALAAQTEPEKHSRINYLGQMSLTRLDLPLVW